MRYDVYLVKGRASYFSKSYLRETGATKGADWLVKKHGHLGYTTRIDPVEEDKPKKQRISVFESYRT